MSDYALYISLVLFGGALTHLWKYIRTLEKQNEYLRKALTKLEQTYRKEKFGTEK